MSSIKLKRFIDIYTGNSISDGDKDKYTIQNENTIPYISTKDIEAGSNKVDYYNDMYIDILKNPKFKIADKNSILLCIEGGSAGKKITQVNQRVCFVNKLCCFNPSKEYNKQFVYFYLQSDLFLSQFKLNVTGLIGGVSQSIIKEFNIPFYSIDLQEKIANYLDNKTSKIDQTIKDNKKEIELLEEYKIQLISKIIKEDEENSNIIKLKFLGNLQNGISAGAEKFGTGNETFINYGDVYNNFEIPENPVGKIYLTDREKETYSLEKGDVLFTRTSETIEEVGMTSVCMKDYPNSAYSGFVIRFRPNTEKLLYEGYSKYYFKMREHRDYFAREMNLVTRASLSQGLLNNLIVILPDYNKQIEISNILDKKLDLINKSIEHRQQIIEKLQEYKKSLIYEVVTGKKEV
ncbi:MAG: restriction endonuclease subunit S [Clostridia bacterium]